MRRIKGKRALYILISIALCMIQFVRATQYDGVALPVVNCTGLLVMILIISQIGVKRLLNRTALAYTGLCILTLILLKTFGGYFPDQFKRVVSLVLNAWLIGVLLFFFLREVFTNKSIRVPINVITILWYVFTTLVVIGNSGKFWPIWFFIIFGMHYITPASKQENEILFYSLIDGIIISFFLIQGFALLFRPFDVVRYSGSFTNCNDMAMYYLIVYSAILSKLHILHDKEANLLHKTAYFVLAGGDLALQFMTGSRTAWAVSMLITIVFAFWVMKSKWGDGFGKLFLKGMGLLGCFLFMIPVVYLAIRYVPTIHPHPVWFMDEYSEERVHSWDPRDSEKYVSFEEMLDSNIGRVLEIFQICLDESPLAIRAYAESIQGEKVYIEYWDEVESVLGHNSFTARLAFARGYLEHSTWMGRKDSDYTFFQKTFPGHDDQVFHSQNLWVQMIFYYGYIAGGIVIVLSLLTIYTQFKNIKKNNESYLVFSLLITLVMFAFGMLENVWNPGTLILVLFFLVQKQGTHSLATDFRHRTDYGDDSCTVSA